MHRDRSLALAAALLSTLALGLAATALDATPVGTGIDAPAEPADGEGLSLLAALWLLVSRLLAMVGVDPGGVAPPAGRSLLAALLDALTALRPLVEPLAVVLALGWTVLLVRRRLPGSTVAGRFDLPWRDAADPPTRAERDWPAGEPDGPVARRWAALVARLDADRPRSRTPGEWAEAAVDAGLDPGAVARLTDAFRAVRYGDAEESDERDRADRALEALDEP